MASVQLELPFSDPTPKGWEDPQDLIDEALMWVSGIEEDFGPRMPDQIQKNESPRPIPETYLAYAASLICALSSELENNLPD